MTMNAAIVLVACCLLGPGALAASASFTCPTAGDTVLATSGVCPTPPSPPPYSLGKVTAPPSAGQVKNIQAYYEAADALPPPGSLPNTPASAVFTKAYATARTHRDAWVAAVGLLMQGSVATVTAAERMLGILNGTVAHQLATCVSRCSFDGAVAHRCVALCIGVFLAWFQWHQQHRTPHWRLCIGSQRPEQHVSHG